MVRGLLYLQWWSWFNRLAAQCRRLKQPKYLIGALVGGAYFYFFFLRPVWFVGSPARPGWAPAGGAHPEWFGLAEVAGALVLLVVVVASWLFPKDRAALDFSQAEIAFLFPAPISRRTLIHYKLLKSQARILLSALILALVTGRFGGPGRLWMQPVAWWVLMCTLSLHGLGASFTVTRLRDFGVGPWPRRVILVGALAAVGGLGFGWTYRELPPLDLEVLGSLRSLLEYLDRLTASGPLWWLVLPARWLVQPFMAPTPLAFLWALGPALGLLMLHYCWVLRAEVAFEEASIEQAQARERLIAAARAGRGGLVAAQGREVRPPFLLLPKGPRLVALIWKNLIAATGLFSWRFWLLIMWCVLALALLGGVVTSGKGWVAFLGPFLMGCAPLVFLVGPHLVPFDFRQDLQAADVLKTYPLRGWELVLGEVLAPTVLLTMAQWVYIGLVVALFQGRQHELIPLTKRLAFGLSAVVLCGPLNAVWLLITNASVLMFPAWLRVGPGGAQGVEVTGQRLVLMVGQGLALLLTLLVPGVLFWLVHWLVGAKLPLLLGLPLASSVAALALGLEVGLGVLMFGDRFERWDLAEDPAG